jgi:hypothetical protein
MEIGEVIKKEWLNTFENIAYKRYNELMTISNECPTLDNKINCSECTYECKLRMQPEQSKEDIPPEYPPAVIYY